MSGRGLHQIVTRLRSGLVRAVTPPAAQGADLGLTYLNEGTLLGISVPAPRRDR
ncbi:hypothetical protein [Candidatus Mycolicibacterium alkanivorans]|uniref:Uncharacterized protein n=1 Tax=Candidatus Mycolicibacterium alkanivorans TaxID=2954114 RepID=A0ABS9YVW1_9MYCO|nr:hypothetical protein [Candidatus Mycolicibacterium alkanivorans]MCI4675248.1 hypothetical protein [Candidatus Mycolicibacterium alkanivorans]